MPTYPYLVSSGLDFFPPNAIDIDNVTVIDIIIIIVFTNSNCN